MHALVPEDQDGRRMEKNAIKTWIRGVGGSLIIQNVCLLCYFAGVLKRSSDLFRSILLERKGNTAPLHWLFSRSERI